MGKSEEAMEKLKVAVGGSHDYLKKSEKFALQYVTEIVCPPLRDVLKDLCLRIEERHKVDGSESEKNIFVVHYTSIANLVSMLQDASKEQERKDKESEIQGQDLEPDPTPDDKNSLWRLYDSVHLNDPEEGSFLIRNLPKKYDWLRKREESHAYIASFILPKTKKDMSNNLVFWRTYGKEGEGCSLSLRAPRGRLQRVLYDITEVKRTAKVLKPVLDSLEPLVRIRKLSICEGVQKILAGVVWEYLEKIRYLYKSEAYDHENECRSVVAEKDIQDKDRIRFEDQDRKIDPAHVRHYYELKDLAINKLLVTGSVITLGPCVSHPYNVEYYLKTLLRRANLEFGPIIKTSKIAYRKS